MKTGQRLTFNLAVAAIMSALSVTASAQSGPRVDAIPHLSRAQISSPLDTLLARFETPILEMASGDAAKARVLKEQWATMYNSLAPQAQSRFYTEFAKADERTWKRLLSSDLPRALAAQHQTSIVDADQHKLSASDPELVFVPTAPCRVADTRFWTGGLGGAIAPFTSRQIYAYSTVSGYNYGGVNQGGTGIAGSGDCSATVFPSSGPQPRSVLATVVAISNGAAGNFRAWNGSGGLPASSMINFSAGQVIANTTVIPTDRGAPLTTANPTPSEFKRDFAIYNDSGTSSHAVVDVVGYFIKPATYEISCTNVDGAGLISNTTGFKSVSAPACPVGSQRTGVLCTMSATVGANLQSVGWGTGDACEWTQTSASSITFNARSRCCSLP